MKLVELLCKEFQNNGGWPLNVELVVQDSDGHLCFKSSQEPPYYNAPKKEWRILDHTKEGWVGGEPCSQIADDHQTSIVTRHQYEAALAAKNAQAWNGDGAASGWV